MQPLQITEVQVHVPKNIPPDSLLVAFARIILNDQFAINGIRLVRGKAGEGLFISFPREPDRKSGRFHKVCHPIRRETNDAIASRIIAAYEEVKNAA